MRLLIASLLLNLALIAPAAAQTTTDVNASIDNILGDHTQYATAFTALQTAVENDDAEAVAALVAYPLIAKVGERQEIEDEAAFVAAYDSIMTDEIRTVITGQTYESLFVNDQGIMFGNGEVWMTGICKDDSCDDFDVRIITIQSTDG